MKKPIKRPELEKSDFIAKLPKACSDELAAVELFEEIRWGGTPGCVHCGSTNVYKMVDAKTGERSKRFLWRCRDCRKQFTVRIGAVYNETRLPMRCWAYAFWRASTSKKGVAAMELMRHCQISYKSALFLIHRIRFAMAQNPETPEKLTGVVEADETFCGGKPRPRGSVGYPKPVRTRKKVPVIGVVQRDGQIRRKVVTKVSAKNIREFLEANVSPEQSRLMTDESPLYRKVGRKFSGGHHSVHHAIGQYSYMDINTNTIESSFAILKRGLFGIHHAVSRDHLHRYVAHYDFLWNTRKMNDGQRAVAAILASEGKRLRYRDPIAKSESNTNAADGI